MEEKQKEKRIGDKWIGVDLDGTLAEWDGWHGHQHVGEPIPLICLLYTSPSPRDLSTSRMPSSA